MGRLKNLFRGKEKSDDSPSANPYDQGPPVDQQSPPPNYDGNQFFSQGSPRNNTRESTGTNPPKYSPGPPGYDSRSPSLASTGPSPNPSSSSPNFPTNARYPTEKRGASDGIGANRYDNSTARQYGQHVAAPTQYQGGYGGLDTQGGNSLPAWPAPQRQTTTSNYAQAGVSDGADGYTERREMTAQEIEDAEVAQIKAEILLAQTGERDSSRRAVALAEEGLSRINALTEDLDRQAEIEERVLHNVEKAHDQNAMSEEHTRQLAYERRFLFKPGYRSSKKDKIAAEMADKEVRRQLRQEDFEREARQRKQEITLGDNSTRVLSQPTPGARDLDRFKLEDDDGEQQAVLEESEQNKMRLLQLSQGLSAGADGIGRRLEQSNIRIGQITERVESAREGVVKVHARMNRAAGMK